MVAKAEADGVWGNQLPGELDGNHISSAYRCALCRDAVRNGYAPRLVRRFDDVRLGSVRGRNYLEALRKCLNLSAPKAT